MSEPDLLPPNSTPLERAISSAAARTAVVPVPVRDVWDPNTCPVTLLAWLAWAFSVDQWDAGWSEEQKRKAIKSAVPVHRHKGTIGAVREALTVLGIDVRVQEWFNQTPAGDPYTFRVLMRVDDAGISQSAMRDVLAMIERNKNLRSHLSRVDLTVTSRSGPFSAGCAAIGAEITLPATEIQLAQVTWGFIAAENLLNAITNIDLANALRH